MAEKRLNDDVETVKLFCYLRNPLNTSGGSETSVVARTRIGWMRFRECGKDLYERRFLLMIKVYQICVKSPIAYGSEIRCLREREVELFTTDRVMIRAIYEVKLIDRKNTKEFNVNIYYCIY